MVLALTAMALRLVPPTADANRTLLPLPLPVMLRLRVAATSPSRVLVTDTMALLALVLKLVFAPKVIGPMYVWLPVVLTELPFKAMAVALSVTLARAALLPTAPSSTTRPVVLLAFTFSARAVPSLLTVPLRVITAAVSVASKLVPAPRVMAPRYIWLPLVLMLAPLSAMLLALTVMLVSDALLPMVPLTTVLPPALLRLMPKAWGAAPLLVVLLSLTVAVALLALRFRSVDKVSVPLKVWLPLDVTLPFRLLLPVTHRLPRPVKSPPVTKLPLLAAVTLFTVKL